MSIAGEAAASPTPSASPSAGPSVSPAPSPILPPPVLQASPTPATSATPTTAPTPSGPAQTASVSPAVMVTGSAATAQVAGFTYLGLKSVRTKAGVVQSLEFSMTSATFTDFQLLLPCSNHVRLAMRGLAAPVEARAGVLVLLVASFQANINGVAVSYTVASPPLGQPLPGGSGTLATLTFSDVATTADRLVMQRVAFRAVSC